jgi:hypothetical protein
MVGTDRRVLFRVVGNTGSARSCTGIDIPIKYSVSGYFTLDFWMQAGLLLVVNQQVRFVLSDQHWDGLKKLSAIGIT